MHKFKLGDIVGYDGIKWKVTNLNAGPKGGYLGVTPLKKESAYIMREYYVSSDVFILVRHKRTPIPWL